MAPLVTCIIFLLLYFLFSFFCFLSALLIVYQCCFVLCLVCSISQCAAESGSNNRTQGGGSGGHATKVGFQTGSHNVGSAQRALQHAEPDTTPQQENLPN